MTRGLAPLALLCALLVSSDARGDPPTRLRYVVRSDAALTELRVEACIDGSRPNALVPGAPSAAGALTGARDGAGRALPTSSGRLELTNAAGCVTYRVDLDAALDASPLAGRFDGDVLASAGVWLWRPPRLPEGGATLRFELPHGLRAAVPWPLEDGLYRLSASAFQRPAFLAIGRFAPLTLTHGGAEITAVRLGGGWTIDDAGTTRWLSRMAEGVSTVEGRFPVDRLLVLLVSTSGSGIRFGMVRRGGGHSVAFLVGRGATAADLEQSWVSWHELTHLYLPAMRQEDAWLYEGLATYYQEVLRARAGVQSPAAAWSELLDGFDRGARDAGTGLSLESEAQAMRRTRAFHRVYWAGTAFALHADVELRTRGSSLDRAIAGAARVWRRRDRIYGRAELWDRPLERAVLRPMGARWAARATFPDIAELVRRLGVHRAPGRGGAVELRPAELSAVRDAIMQR